MKLIFWTHYEDTHAIYKGLTEVKRNAYQVLWVITDLNLSWEVLSTATELQLPAIYLSDR